MQHEPGMNRLFRVGLILGLATACLAQEPASRPAVPVADAVATAEKWLADPARRDAVASPYPAIEIEHRVYAAPRPINVLIVKVDLSAPGTEFVLTKPDPSKGDDGKPYETRSQTTLAFAKETGVQLAVNTSAFGPLRGKPGEPMDVAGLAAVEGKVFSKPAKRYGAIYISREGRVSLKQPADEKKNVWTVIPGFRMLIDDREICLEQAESDTPFGGLNPRTAVGVDRDGRTLWIVVVDGRQPEFSMGMTLAEMAALFRGLGVWDALNLDGGGSSTLVLQGDDGEHRVLNTTVGGKLRQVANNLGLRLAKKGGASKPAPPGSGAGAKP